MEHPSWYPENWAQCRWTARCYIWTWSDSKASGYIGSIVSCFVCSFWYSTAFGPTNQQADGSQMWILQISCPRAPDGPSTRNTALRFDNFFLRGNDFRLTASDIMSRQRGSFLEQRVPPARGSSSPLCPPPHKRTPLVRVGRATSQSPDMAALLNRPYT